MKLLPDLELLMKLEAVSRENFQNRVGRILRKFKELSLRDELRSSTTSDWKRDTRNCVEYQTDLMLRIVCSNRSYPVIIHAQRVLGSLKFLSFSRHNRESVSYRQRGDREGTVQGKERRKEHQMEFRRTKPTAGRPGSEKTCVSSHQ